MHTPKTSKYFETDEMEYDSVKLNGTEPTNTHNNNSKKLKQNTDGHLMKNKIITVFLYSNRTDIIFLEILKRANRKEKKKGRGLPCMYVLLCGLLYILTHLPR